MMSLLSVHGIGIVGMQCQCCWNAYVHVVRTWCCVSRVHMLVSLGQGVGIVRMWSVSLGQGVGVIRIRCQCRQDVVSESLGRGVGVIGGRCRCWYHQEAGGLIMAICVCVTFLRL